MNKKTNIYLCVTEYHVLLSILLATEEYGSNGFENKIVLCNEGRFNDKGRYNYSRSGNIDYYLFDLDHFRSKTFYDEVVSCCTGYLFIFNMNNPHFLYFSYKLKQNKQAKTAFVQEGLASYNIIKYKFRERLSRIKTDISILAKAGVKNTSFYLFCFGHRGCFGKILNYYWKAVDSSLVDVFWLSYPEEAKYGRNKTQRLPDFTSKSINAANEFFKYQDSLWLNKNDMVFVDQGIVGSYRFVSELSQTFPDAHIYVKLHPRTRPEIGLQYKSISNVELLSKLQGIPIELFLLNLRHVIVITPFSSALLLNNPMCRYYYSYKWNLKYGYNIENDSLYTPGKHIRFIENVEDIELY